MQISFSQHLIEGVLTASIKAERILRALTRRCKFLLLSFQVKKKFIYTEKSEESNHVNSKAQLFKAISLCPL